MKWNEQGEEDDGSHQPDSLEQDEDEGTGKIQEDTARPKANQEQNTNQQPQEEEKKQDQAYHEPETLERPIENDGRRRNYGKDTDPDAKNPDITGQDNHKQADYRGENRIGGRNKWR